VSAAEVVLWGNAIGAVLLEDDRPAAVFQYTPAFAAAAPVEPSPLTMPVRRRPYEFPGLAADAFHGLPGMLADSLPDRYGNAVIDTWLAVQGRRPDEFDAIERLCYVGTRGMGALEYRPATGPQRAADVHDIDVGALAELAAEVLADREALVASLAADERTDAMRDILAVGTSAGGARAKAVIAWNPQTNQIRSGQVRAPRGFEHWLLKFDGVAGSGDRGLTDPLGYGAIEQAYALMARAAGIEMSETRLLEEGGRRHFMTRRFDRTPDGHKLHMQSLGGLAQLDYNDPAAHGYEQALLAIRGLPMEPEAQGHAMEQMVRRAIFNVVARNQDDHVKNVAFLMGPDGAWSLSPAFDLTYANDPANRWMARHQMSITGRREHFTLADFDALAATAPLPRGRARRIHAEVHDAVARWPAFAEQAGVDERQTERIAAAHRLDIPA
jgi:serine/threonine-protein kinase HipA